MGYLRKHYLAACDPFHLGYTSHAQVALGYGLTRGMVFPWTGGGVLLLRRRLYPTPGPWSYCGFARPGETTITNMLGFAHEADMAFQYTAVSALGSGLVSRLHEPVRLDLDSGGNRITPALPMFPLNITATALSGGKFDITWHYDPFGQGDYPTDFQVFRGASAATVDYGTPLVDSVTGLSTVAYEGGRHAYGFTTAAYADRTQCVFAARARNSGGVAELNTLTSATQRATAATPAAAITASLRMTGSVAG